MTRWALSARDQRYHAVDEQACAPGLVVGRCAHRMPAHVDITTSPPAGAETCVHCAAHLTSDVLGPPVHYVPRGVRPDVRLPGTAAGGDRRA